MEATVSTVRVDEELHIVDDAARSLALCAEDVVARLHGGSWSASSDGCSLVSRTMAHRTLRGGDGLVAELRGTRRQVGQAASDTADGRCSPLAAGVVPRHRTGVHSTGGTRIIVERGTGDGEGDNADVLAVCRGVSRHLPVLLALSASSPFDDDGVDTGYASFRYVSGRRWPVSGPYPEASTMIDYRAELEFIREMTTQAADGAMHYDVQPADPAGRAVEITLCDAVSSTATVGVLAALARGLVDREYALQDAGEPTPPLSTVRQRTLTWRAARCGLEGWLLDPTDLTLRPAEDVVVSLLDLVDGHLGEDTAWVRGTVDQLLKAGSAAYRQRRALRRRGRTDDVIDLLVAETLDMVGLEDATPSTTLGLAAYEPSVVDELGEEFWDEAVDASGEPRPASAPALAALVDTGALELRSRVQEAEEDLTAHGVTFRATGTDRHVVFPIDPVPRIITESTWSILAAGVEQRMRALNAFLDDVYNDREILRAGVIDVGTLERAPGYRRVGRHAPRGRVRNHLNGADMVCSDDGRWQILEDNVRMPSGLTFSLAARDVTRRHFPEALDATEREVGEVVDPDGALAVMCETLRMAAPPGVDPQDACVVVATAGTADSTYAEQLSVARVGGFVLRTTDQLVVDADDRGVPTLWDVSHARRHRVDVVYMRMEEEMFLSSPGADGEALRESVQAALAAGTVAVANALGNGVADDKAVYARVPEMIEFYLGESPSLDQVPTYLCSVREERDMVLDRLDELVVKPIDGYGGAGITVGPEATGEELEVRRRELLTHPDQFIAQEVIRLSTLPTFDGHGIQRRHVDLRMFSHLRQTGGDGADVEALTVPAGLTRVAPAGSMIVNSSRGGGGKDTWILRDVL